MPLEKGTPVSEHSAATARHRASSRPRGVRPEIQALRAVAVLAVVLYHLWPGRLPGGFVGVDIFFVISGFLITSHLVREVDRTGGISLAQFWARRARRLLPASILVLVSAALLVVAFVPQSYWLQFFREIGAATIYLENWQLAADAVDYLAADNEASPVQHFWSLSVEEQFYIAWPLIVVAAAFLSGVKASAARRRIFVAVALGVVTVASLVFSILWTSQDAASAYFITPTRAWEFGAGGLLGILSVASVRFVALRTVVSWLGWATIGFSVLVYSDALPFPGFLAIVPVLGTLAVMWGGTPRTGWSATRLVSLRPVQFVGDISYSLYLWHWPLIVIAPFLTGQEIGSRVKLVILGLSVLLAFVTKIMVEDPARSRRFFLSHSPRVTFVSTAAAMVLVLAATAGGSLFVQHEVNVAAAQADRIAAGDVECFGAPGIDRTCDEPLLDGVLVPAPVLNEDRGDAFDDGCMVDHDSAELIRCNYGSERTDAVVVALVGDSHASMWLAALQEIAEAENMRIETFLKSGCAYNAVDTSDYMHDSELCDQWKVNVDDQLARMPELSMVVTSYRSSLVKASKADTIEGFEKLWNPLVERGIDVVAIADVAEMRKNSVACVDSKQDSGDYSSCAMPRDDAFAKVADRQKAAADRVGATYIDLNPYLCDDKRCFMVVGHVMTFRDPTHLSATFARTVGPLLGAALP